MSETRPKTTVPDGHNTLEHTRSDHKKTNVATPSTPSRSCILGKEQAKKRLQAFSKQKQYQEQRLSSSNQPKSQSKEQTKYRSPTEKPKRELLEIEKIKRSDERTHIPRTFAYEDEMIHRIVAEPPSMDKKKHSSAHSTGLDAIKAYNDRASSDEMPDRDRKSNRDDHRGQKQDSDRHRRRDRSKERLAVDTGRRSSSNHGFSIGRRRSEGNFSRRSRDRQSSQRRSSTDKHSKSFSISQSISSDKRRRSDFGHHSNSETFAVECADGQIRRIPSKYVKHTTTTPVISYSTALPKEKRKDVAKPEEKANVVSSACQSTVPSEKTNVVTTPTPSKTLSDKNIEQLRTIEQMIDKVRNSPDTDEYASAWEDDSGNKTNFTGGKKLIVNHSINPLPKVPIESLITVKSVQPVIDLNSFDIESLPTEEELLPSTIAYANHVKPDITKEDSDREVTPPLLLKEIESVLEKRKVTSVEPEDSSDGNSDSDDSDSSAASSSSSSSSPSSSSTSSSSSSSSDDSSTTSSSPPSPQPQCASIMDQLAKIDQLHDDEALFSELNLLKSMYNQKQNSNAESENCEKEGTPQKRETDHLLNRPTVTPCNSELESPGNDRKIAFLLKPTQITPIKEHYNRDRNAEGEDLDFTDRLSLNSKPPDDRSPMFKERHSDERHLQRRNSRERINNAAYPNRSPERNRPSLKRPRSRSIDRPFRRSRSRDWSPKELENRSRNRDVLLHRARSRSIDSKDSYESRVMRRHSRRSFSPSPLNGSPTRRSVRKSGRVSPRRRSPIRAGRGRFRSPSPTPSRTRMRRSYSPDERRPSSPSRRLMSPIRRPSTPPRRLLSPTDRRSCSPMRWRNASPGRRDSRQGSPPWRDSIMYRDDSPRGFSPKRSKGPRSPPVRGCPRTPPIMGSETDEWANDSSREAFYTKGYPILTTNSSGAYSPYPPTADKQAGMPFYESTPPPWNPAHCDYNQYLAYSTPPPQHLSNTGFGNVMHSPKRMSLDERIGNIENGGGQSANPDDPHYNNYYNPNSVGQPPQVPSREGYYFPPFNGMSRREIVPPVNSNLISVDTSHNPFVRKGNVLEIVPAAVVPTMTPTPTAIEVVVKPPEKRVKKSKKARSLKSCEFRKQLLRAQIKQFEKLYSINKDKEEPSVSPPNEENIRRSILRQLVEANENVKARKVVMFADGVAPGYGTSATSDDDELKSPTDKVKRIRRKSKRSRRGEKENLDTLPSIDPVPVVVEEQIPDEPQEIDASLYLLPPPPAPPGSPPPSAPQPVPKFQMPPNIVYFHYNDQTQSMFMSRLGDWRAAIQEYYQKNQPPPKAGQAPRPYPTNIIHANVPLVLNPAPLPVPPPVTLRPAAGLIPPFPVHSIPILRKEL